MDCYGMPAGVRNSKLVHRRMSREILNVCGSPSFVFWTFPLALRSGECPASGTCEDTSPSLPDFSPGGYEVLSGADPHRVDDSERPTYRGLPKSQRPVENGSKNGCARSRKVEVKFSMFIFLKNKNDIIIIIILNEKYLVRFAPGIWKYVFRSKNSILKLFLFCFLQKWTF